MTPARTQSDLNKVVVALLNGPRLKGYVYNFSPLRDSFHLLPPENPLQQHGTEVALKDVKAIFFVADFVGKRDHTPNPLPDESLKQGRKIEVTCLDGEKLTGTTVAYNPHETRLLHVPCRSGIQ